MIALPDYARLDWKSQQHHIRFARHVLSRTPRLVCQECRGEGGWTEPLLDDGTGPRYSCGYCEGLGYTTAWMRGYWLRDHIKPKEKKS